MKTPLRLCLVLVLMALAQSYAFAQTITTSLSSLTNVKTGITQEFSVTTSGPTAQSVVGKLDFDPYQANDIILQYQAPGATEFTTLTLDANGIATFGPFALTQTDAVHNFKILFNRADNYSYSLRMFEAANPTNPVGAAATGSVAVTTLQEPTIDGTLDNYPTLETNNNIEWQIFVEANDRAGDKANIEIALATPAQRNNFVLEYDVNRAIMNPSLPVNFQPLTFNEDGIARIGPAEGETLTAIAGSSDINQIMRIRFTQPGTYAYSIRLRRDDGNIIAFVNETVTVTGLAGMDDMIGSTRISVYPTLVSDAVRVDLGDVRNASIVVTDLLGRTVMQLKNKTGVVDLNTNGLAKGTYLVKITKGNDVAGARFVVR